MTQVHKTPVQKITIDRWEVASEEDVRENSHSANSMRKYSPGSLIKSQIFLATSSAIFYGFSSFVIMLINKSVLTDMHFPSAQVLGIGQMFATIVILFCLKRRNIVSFPDLNRSVPYQIWPLPLFYIGNLLCGLYGTRNLSLPMFVVLRRFTILITLVGEYFLLGKFPKHLITVSVFIMILGALVASSDDLAFDLLGYFYVIANDFMTAANGIYSKKKLDAKELGKYGVLYYNCLFMIIPAILLSLCTEDLDKIINYNKLTESNFMLMFTFSCVMGFVLMYSMLTCTHHNSALTTTIIGSVKNILVTYYGVLFGSDYLFSVTNFIGLNISAFGSLIYTYLTFFKYSTKN